MRHGTYEVLEPLGRGATATVYRARQVGLDRLVALKVLHRGLDAESRRRFERELKHAIGLAHPGLVRVLDGDPAAAEPYLVMELVEGETLAGLLEREGSLPVERVLVDAARLVEALEYLHARGLLHRDLKPGNLMIPRDGGLKVADFGLARPEIATLLTPVGTIIGTLAYMAPEVLLGGPTTPAADAWAVGAILHEMLVGRQLIEQDSLPAWIERLRARRLMLPGLDAPEIPRGMAELTRALLSFEPGARPALDEALIERLKSIATAPADRHLTRARPTSGRPDAASAATERAAPAPASEPGPGPGRGSGRRAGLLHGVLVLVIGGGGGMVAVDAWRQHAMRAELARARAARDAGRDDEAIASCRTVLAMQPASSGAAELAAVLLAKRRRFEEAEDLVEGAFGHGADSPELRIHHVSLLLAQKKYDEAERALDEAREKGHAWAALHRGLMREQQGRFTEAEALLREALSVPAAGVETHGHLARVLLHQGKIDEAHEHAELARSGRPGTPWILTLSGRIHARAGRFDEAEKSHAESIRHAPEDPAPRFALGQFLMTRERLEEAEEATGRAADMAPDNLEYLIGHATALFRIGNLGAMEARARQALRLDRKSADALALLGESVLDQVRQDRGKLGVFEREVEPVARELHPDFPGLLDLRGRWHDLRGELEEARSLLDEAVRRAPSEPAHLLRLAGVLLRMKRLDEALEKVTRCRSLDGDSPVTLHMLADILEAKDDPEAALPLRKHLVNSRHPRLWSHHRASLGITLDKLGRHDEALTEFREAIRGEIHDPQRMRGIAMKILLDKHPVEALAYLTRLRPLLPDDSEIDPALALLRACEPGPAPSPAPVTGVTPR